MDYAIDNYFGNNIDDREIRTDFVYDERRIYSKVYLLLKSFGLVFYTLTFTRCDRPAFFLVMNTVTFLSILNSARYEYIHYRRYGTTFSSVEEYKLWKQQQLPKTRIIFAGTEFGIKIWYIINSFPPQIDFDTPCNVGKGILYIHISGLIIVYLVVGVFSVYILCTSCCYDATYYQSHRYNVSSRDPGSLPLPILNNVVLSTAQECCICMDNECIQPWRGLPCGHMFHASCVSRWIDTHHTCPVCRFDMRIIV